MEKLRNFWQDNELLVLKNNFPFKSYEELIRLLPGRTKVAIKIKVRDMVFVFIKYKNVQSKLFS